ncbi:MAG: aminotransferase class V-fold PLP-dependent enzyme [Phycisphaerales bacterium]|jgi:isopenicillin-N epimerase|nr:aminotransferase class V-fold PLP-dependent enzyme [Phycisphaerales bacterium]
MSTLPAPSAVAHHWGIDPGVVYLNHGSFGACPTRVLDAQRSIIDGAERELVAFYVTDAFEMLDAARAALAPLIGAHPDDFAFVSNATTGVATALANFPLRAGDEILVSAHEYPACLIQVRDAARRAGATVRFADIPFGVGVLDERAIFDAIVNAATERTRLCLLSNVTSPTALRFPVARIVRALRERNIETILDAAHGPGCVPLDLDAIGAAWSTGNCHKWLCAPKGSAFLHVRRDAQRGPLTIEGVFRPLALSHFNAHPIPGREMPMRGFDFLGTSDVSAWLTVPHAMRIVAEIAEEVGLLPRGLDPHDSASLTGAWRAIMDHNRALCLRGRNILCDAMGVSPPAHDDLIGPIATIPLPAHDAERTRRLLARPTRHADALQDALRDRWKIQVPIWRYPPGPVDPSPGAPAPVRTIRISAQLYNSEAQYRYLADALCAEIERERQY